MKYKKWLEKENLILVEGWARGGLSDEDIAHNMGISASTLYDMKKLTVLFLSLMLILAFAGCNKELDSGSGASTTQEDPQATETQTTDTQDGNILVVYYSATGNTEDVANAIAEATNGDLFQLEPQEPYSDGDLDWTDDNSRVVAEHDNPEDRDVALVADTAENWDTYDTVFIGYPIWWGIAAWPVDGFIEANDFTGKTVVPFCTSTSSDLGESGQLLADQAGTGNWLEGERFASGASEEAVREWVESLSL